jgi:Flp pilus assembly protein TadG
MMRALIRARTGAMAPMFALALPALTAAVGFAVDGAAMRLAQARLQVAADAAAAAASRRLDSSSAAQAEAVRMAQANLPPDGHGMVLAANDVETGAWNNNSRNFTNAPSNLNAVRVTTRYAQANGNPFRLLFGAVFSLKTIDLAATATAICPSNPTLSQISNNIPSRIAVVTMGQACSPGSGLTGTCYWATPQGNPIVRVDNWNPGVTTITVRITSPTRFAGLFSFTAPAAGQYWVVVPNVQMNNVASGAPAENIVFRIHGSSPTVPANRINTSGTATYNNRFNSSATLPGSALCAFSSQAAASRLVN